MVSKNDGDGKSPGELLKELSQKQSSINARLVAEVEFLREIVRELAKHLSVSEEEWKQILQRAYNNLHSRIDEIAQIYIGEENNK
jgi:energy-converting hydrogenase A subunit M